MHGSNIWVWGKMEQQGDDKQTFFKAVLRVHGFKCIRKGFLETLLQVTQT